MPFSRNWACQPCREFQRGSMRRRRLALERTTIPLCSIAAGEPGKSKFRGKLIRERGAKFVQDAPLMRPRDVRAFPGYRPI